MQRISLTTWSIHPYLSDGSLALVDMPARVKQAGISTVEICHFHFPETSREYVAALREAARAAEVEIFSILVDAFDISQADPQAREHDINAVAEWIDIAAWLGASHVRVIAGEAAASDRDALRRSIIALTRLQQHAQARGVTVISENFKALAIPPANWLAIHEALGHGGCADIGNFPAATRVSDFAQVAAHAASIHVKASYAEDGTIQPAEVQACLAAARAHGFAGPTTLVYDRPDERWQGIATLHRIVSEAFAS
jgi:sugar phosphate isomerase/epimerase